MNDPLREPDLAWLRNLARALVGESDAADDLVQDTVLAASRVDGVRESSRGWLATVARRLAARRRRGEAARSRREVAVARSEALPDPTELVERAEIAEAVVRAARSLDEPFRTAVLSHFLDGRSIAEIARADGRPQDTVRWRIRRGLERLRERLTSDGRDWSQWSVLLLPLARVGHVSPGLAAVGGASRVSGLLAASWLSMKVWTFVPVVAAAVFGLTALWIWPTAASDATGPASRDPGGVEVADSSLPATLEATAPPVLESVERTQPSSERAAPRVPKVYPNLPPSALACRVVDEARRPIPNARVELLEVDEPDQLLGEFVADDRGRAVLDLGAFTDLDGLGLVATAPGWLRNAVRPKTFAAAFEARGSEPLTIVLRRGVALEGRVVDLSGQPIAGLNLRLHPLGAGVAHVSPSRIALNVERRRRNVRDRAFQSAVGRTDNQGRVTFVSVPAREDLVVRSVDPEWSIVRPSSIPGDSGFVEWVAVPVFGVVVKAIDANTREVVPTSAVFGVDLEFLDGTVKPVSQWVGSGIDGASFAFDRDLYPPFDVDVLRSVTFFGTLSTANESRSWRAEPILVASRKWRADVEVLVAPQREDGGFVSSVPEMTVLLDVVDASGQPYAGELNLEWSSDTRRGSPRDDTRPERVAPGSYRAQIPVPGDVETIDLRVARANASGSLTPFTTSVAADFEKPQRLSVTLPEAGSVTILRPAGYRSAWSIDASYRDGAGSDWFGAWTFGTDEDKLVLRSVRPATWRFQLRCEARPEDRREILVTVRGGEAAVVGG